VLVPLEQKKKKKEKETKNKEKRGKKKDHHVSRRSVSIVVARFSRCFQQLQNQVSRHLTFRVSMTRARVDILMDVFL